MTRIAIVLGGGASLGSYIGGAIPEILAAAESPRARGRVIIDVLAGSSAGALGAAVAARALMVNRHLLPWIEWAWVDAADASVLLDPARTEREGWLDVTALEELTRALVAGDRAADDEPSPAAGRSLRVGLSLANLHGVPYEHAIRFLNAPERTFVSRVYSDDMRFEVSSKQRAGDPVWDRMATAAVASASFPFAFPARRIDRDRSDYPNARLPRGRDGRVSMWYVDGGLFDNAPLGLARNLVELGEDHQAEDRRYIFVEPTLQSSSLDSGTPVAPPASLTGMASALARAVLGQSAARDWTLANRLNTRLVILRSLVARLPEIAPDLLDADAVGLGRYIGELAESVAEIECVAAGVTRQDGHDPVVDHLEARTAAIESDPAYSETLGRVDSRAGRSRLAKLCASLRSSS